MAKSGVLIGRLLILIGLSCFINCGMSMLRFRRFITQDETVETYDVPFDVKVEVIAGLLMCVLGAIASGTSQLENIDLLHYYQNKTMMQVQNRRNFRSVRNTRGKLFKSASQGAVKIPTVEESTQRHPHIKKLALASVDAA